MFAHRRRAAALPAPTSDYSATPIGLLYWDTDVNSGSCRVSLGNAYPYGTTLGIWPPNQLSCDAAQCGATQNTCDSGQYLAYNESLGQWACLTAGPNNAGNVIVCMPPVDGACGTADNAVQGCTAGTWQDETGDGWTCLGTGGGADELCGGDCMPRAGYGGFYQWVDINGSLFFAIPPPATDVLGYSPSGWGVGDRCLTEVTCIAAQGNWIENFPNNYGCFMPDPWPQSWIDYVVNLIGMCPNPIPLGALCVQTRTP